MVAWSHTKQPSRFQVRRVHSGSEDGPLWYVLDNECPGCRHLAACLDGKGPHGMEGSWATVRQLPHLHDDGCYLAGSLDKRDAEYEAACRQYATTRRGRLHLWLIDRYLGGYDALADGRRPGTTSWLAWYLLKPLDRWAYPRAD